MPPIRKVKDVKKPIEVGELIVHKDKSSGRKRIGEVVGLVEGRSRKFQVLEVNPHDFTPMFKENLSELKFFSCNAADCKRLNLFASLRKTATIREISSGKTGEEGYDLELLLDSLTRKVFTATPWRMDTTERIFLNVEISGRAGLPHKLDSLGQVKRFQADPKHAKLCEVLPMDKNGGVRIKDYWEIKREAAET